MSSGNNHNPQGKNQFDPVPKTDDVALVAALQEYHRQLLSSNDKISQRLLADHGMRMSASTVKRRHKELGLTGSGATTKHLPRNEKEQLVLDAMDRDPARHQGVRAIQQNIAYHERKHLTRDYVSDVMHAHDPDGFRKRDPTSKRINRIPRVPLGIHEQWAGDGHDKLYSIGFPIWAVVESGSGKWLGAWVVPSNRTADTIAYLFLCLVEKLGGMPMQFTTDCGSETTKLYGLSNALRSIFASEIPTDELPAHVYLRSIRNIVIERSWLRLRLAFGNNAVVTFRRGISEGIYKPHDPHHAELCRWIFPKLLRRLLKEFMDITNATRMRKDRNKIGPSGMSRFEAYSAPESWGGQNYLIPVDINIIHELKEAVGGADLVAFVSDEFEQRAEIAFKTLGIKELTLENIWIVFRNMLPLLFT